MKKIKSCLFKTQIFLSVLLLAGLIGCPNNVNKTEEVTITVKGDANVVLGSTTSIKVNKGTKWQTVKDNAAIKAVTFKEGFELGTWKLNDESGDALTDDHAFDADSVVFAVSNKIVTPAEEVTITITGDGNAILGSTRSIKVNKGDKWQTVKNKDAIQKVTFKEGFELDVWKLNDASGAALTDGHVFDADSVVFAVSKNSPPAKQVTITVKGDGNAILGSKTSIKVDKGTSWKDVKSDDAITKVTFKKGFMLNAWKLNNETGDALHDAYLFNDDSVVFAVSKKKNVSTEQVTITIAGDTNVVLGSTTSIKVDKGTKWETVKGKAAITAVNAKKGFVLDVWKLKDASGAVLTDSHAFNADSVVFAVSKKKNVSTEQVTITIAGDTNVVLGSTTSIKVNKGDKWQTVKNNAAIKAVNAKTGFVLDVWKLKDASGIVLTDGYAFDADSVVFAVSQSTKLTITIKGDEHAIIGSVTSIQVDRGALWGTVKKDPAITAVKAESGWSLYEWYLGNYYGTPLIDSHQFQYDATVYVVTKKNKVPTEQVTITVKGDEHVNLVSPASIKVNKGTKWEAVKENDAIKKVTFKTGFELDAWKLNDGGTGAALTDGHVFDTDSVVYAVSKAAKITITIQGDDHIELGTTTSIQVDKGVKWSTVKNDPAIKAVKAKSGYTLVRWCLARAGGLELYDDYDFKDNSVVFAVSQSNKVTITIQGDEHIDLGGANSIEVDRGAKWSTVKNDAQIKAVKGKDGWELDSWHLGSQTGLELYDDYDFRSDVIIFAVSKNAGGASNKVTITITGDSHINKGKTLEVDKGSTWEDVRDDVVTVDDLFEDGWEADEIRLGGSSGAVLDESYVFDKDVTIYIVCIKQ